VEGESVSRPSRCKRRRSFIYPETCLPSRSRCAPSTSRESSADFCRNNGSGLFRRCKAQLSDGRPGSSYLSQFSALAASNYKKQTAAHPNSPSVFRRSSRHACHAGHLRAQLRPILAALESPLQIANELTQSTPIAILAETLGYSPQTLEAHARASASTYARHVATRLD
jgi:hypothetical protein